MAARAARGRATQLRCSAAERHQEYTIARPAADCLHPNDIQALVGGRFHEPLLHVEQLRALPCCAHTPITPCVPRAATVQGGWATGGQERRKRPTRLAPWAADPLWCLPASRGCCPPAPGHALQQRVECARRQISQRMKGVPHGGSVHMRTEDCAPVHVQRWQQARGVHRESSQRHPGDPPASPPVPAPPAPPSAAPSAPRA